MSQDFHHRHQSSFFFPPSSDDGLVESQILRDKIRFQGFEPAAPGAGAVHVHHQLVGVGGHSTTEYETAGMLSEMFDFAGRPSVTVAAPSELVITGLVDQHSHQLTSINNAGDPAAAAMQLFLTNPQPRSPPQQHHQQFPGQGFHPPTISQPQYTWIPEGGGGGVVEGQGLSLSLASSLEAAGGSHHEMMFFNGHEGRVAATASSSNPLQQQQLHFGFGTASSSVFSLAAVNVLRNSKYTRPAQEILEEFCSVGRGHLKKSSSAKLGGAANNSTASTSGSGGATKDPLPLSPADRMEHQRRKVKLAAMLDEVERRYSHYCEQMQMVVNSFDMVMGFGAALPYTALAQKAMSRHFRCLKDAIQAQLKESCEMLGEKDAAGGTGITKGETPRLKVLEQSLRKQRAFHQMGMMEQEAWRPQRGLPERSVNVLRAWLFEHFLNPYPSDADKHLLARQTGLSRNQVANWFINARVRLWKPMIEEMYQQESKANELEEAGVQNDDVQETASDDHHHRHHHHHHQVPANRESESNTTAQNPTEPLPSDVVPITSQINALPETDPSPATYQTQQQHLAPPSVLGAASVGPTPNAQGFIPTASSYSHVIDACNNRFVGTSTATTTGGGGGDSGHHHHDNSDLDGPTMIRFGTTSATNAGDVSLTLGLRHGATPGNHPQEKGGFSFRDFGRAS